MKSYKNKVGLTLVEVLVVLVVIILLVSMVIGIAARIDNQSKERLTENTFALLDAALGQFRDYGYNYGDPCYADFKFPLDCNNFSKDELEDILEDALELNSGDVLITGDHNDVYSGSEAMYFFLSRVPESRKTLDKIDRKLVTNLGLDGNPMEITIDPGVDEKKYPLFRIIDPWGETLRYDYYDEELPPITSTKMGDMRESRKTFPVITSAGPDREFGTADDITSR